MPRKLKSLTKITLNFIIFLSLSLLTFYVLYTYFGKSYISSPPVGGDYFNALTFATFYQNHLLSPLNTWLPFWYAGASALGGYPPLTFYTTSYLSNFFKMSNALNSFSFISLYLFFVASLLMFWQVSKNWLIASALVIILLISQSSYYQLTVGGFIVSASTQWYLPLVLFLLFKFSEKLNTRYFTLACLSSGFSMLHQGPSGFLMTFLPSAALLSVFKFKNRSSKLQHLIVFAVLSFLIGSPGLYSVILKTLIGSGAGLCASEECWGSYPKHLIAWMNLYPVAILAVFLITTIIFFLLKRKLDFKYIVPTIAGLTIPLAYLLASYLKLINGLSVVIFPTRIFWVINLFLLLLAASIFYAFKKSVPYVHYSISALTLLIIIAIVSVKFPIIKTDRPNTIPVDINSYLEKPSNLSQLIPSWIKPEDSNWRTDIYSPGVYQWWYVASKMPTVRGYFNHLPNNNWQYYLDITTRNTKDDKPIIINESYFLFDAFGTKFIENSQSSIPNQILDSKSIVRHEKLRDHLWYEISDSIVTPIISATNSPVVMFIGDYSGYENFIRILAKNNLNSKILIPVKGPDNLNSLKENDLKNISTLILYRYSKNNLSKLNGFLEKGGTVFIETGSLENIPKEKLTESLPVESVIEKDARKNSKFEIKVDAFAKDVDINSFPNLDYRDDSWQITIPKSIRAWAHPILFYGEDPVMVGGEYKNGKIIWSGYNLFFHIVENNNFEEAKLFHNLITYLLPKISNPTPKFSVKRDVPNSITVEGENFNGIYFKENFDSGWNAKVRENNLKVYKAGLDFMYIPIQRDNQHPVEIKYNGSLSTKITFYASLSALIILILVLISPKYSQITFSKILGALRLQLGSKVSKYLEDE